MKTSRLFKSMAVHAIAAFVASAASAADFPPPQFGPSQWINNEGKLSCEATCSKLNATPVFNLWGTGLKLNVCAVNAPNACETGQSLTGYRPGLSLQGNNWCRIAWTEERTCPLFYDFDCLCAFGKPK